MYDELIKRLRRCASYDPRFVIQDCEDAADAIEELEKMLATALLEYQIANNKRLMTEEYAKQKQRWIPVTERLPDVGKDVLCFCRANICLVLSRDGNLWREGADRYYMSGFVSHWMPLPQPPKDGEP